MTSIALIKGLHARLWSSRASLVTGLISSTGWLLMAIIPFSANLDLYIAGAIVYFLGTTSLQLTFAVTELLTSNPPKHLSLMGLVNLMTFSIFSYQLIQVEILQIPGFPEPAIYEWLVFISAIIWVLAHALYSLIAKKTSTSKI